MTHSTRKAKVGESGTQGQSSTKSPNKKFQEKSRGLVTQTFSPTATQAEASGSFRPAYNEILSPKQTENYKKPPSGGASPGSMGEIRMPGRRPGGRPN